MRQAIASDAKSWGKVVGDKGFKATFGDVHGEALARPPRGFDAAHPYIEDIKRKSFFAMSEASVKTAQSPALLGEIDASFKAAKPLMQFLCKAVGAAY